MKKVLVLLLIISCNQPSKKNEFPYGLSQHTEDSLLQADSTNTGLKVEYPPAKTCESNLGILKMNDNGETVGKKTELTELLRLLNNNNCDIIEISYELKGSRGYENIAKKIIYDKREMRLQDVYTKNNVIEDYKDVSADGLRKFLQKGEKSFYSLSNYTNAKYDFNNRQMKQNTVGSQPSQSDYDGSVKVVEDYIKANANDASSIKFIEWSKVIPYGNFWVVRCIFKGTNSFGGVVTEKKWFYIQNDKVVKGIDISEQ